MAGDEVKAPGGEFSGTACVEGDDGKGTVFLGLLGGGGRHRRLQDATAGVAPPPETTPLIFMEPSTTDQQVSIGEPLVFLEPSAPTYQIGGSSLELGSGGDDSGSSEPPSDGGSYGIDGAGDDHRGWRPRLRRGRGKDEGEGAHGHGDSSHTSLSASLLELVEGVFGRLPAVPGQRHFGLPGIVSDVLLRQNGTNASIDAYVSALLASDVDDPCYIMGSSSGASTLCGLVVAPYMCSAPFGPDAYRERGLTYGGVYPQPLRPVDERRAAQLVRRQRERARRARQRRGRPVRHAAGGRDRRAARSSLDVAACDRTGLRQPRAGRRQRQRQWQRLEWQRQRRPPLPAGRGGRHYEQRRLRRRQQLSSPDCAVDGSGCCNALRSFNKCSATAISAPCAI